MTDCDGLITNLRNANNAARIDLDAIKAQQEYTRSKCPVCQGRDAGMSSRERHYRHESAMQYIDALIAEVERLRAIVEARP